MKNNQRNHIGTFMYLTQVKAVLFAIISATSLSVSWLPPLSKPWYCTGAIDAIAQMSFYLCPSCNKKLSCLALKTPQLHASMAEKRR